MKNVMKKVAAKHGLAGLTKTVALEVAEHGITCNGICPGYVKTPLVENQIADGDGTGAVCAGRQHPPEPVAAAQGL